METLGLRPGCTPGTGTVLEDQTLQLVSRVREARLQASDTRLAAIKVMALVSGTTLEIHRTRRQTARIRDERWQAARSRAAARERVPLSSPRIAEAAVPGKAPAPSPGAGLPKSPPATLRRAVAFIDEHAHEAITVADIAAASYVTVRGVQLAFQLHMGTTPTRYLRQVRIERAHRDLMAGDPALDSVTAVAYRWGFPSASRFAAYYHGAYGMSPSGTLRAPEHVPSPRGTAGAGWQH